MIVTRICQVLIRKMHPNMGALERRISAEIDWSTYPVLEVLELMDFFCTVCYIAIIWLVIDRRIEENLGQ